MSDEHDEFMVSAAVKQVARKAIADALIAHPPEWGDYPDIGEHDWARVERELDRYAAQFTGQHEKYDAAYRFLAGRANKEAL